MTDSSTIISTTRLRKSGGLVPRLRFPEFEGEPWEQSTINQCCEVLNSRRAPISAGARTAGSIPYYGASGIVDYIDDYIFDEELLLVGEDGAKWGAFENTAFIARGKYWVNNHAHVLKPHSMNIVLLENYLVKTDVFPFVTGAAPPKLTLARLKSISVPRPPTLPEQQKIADCLSSLDDLIGAESEKLEALKVYKKGLMQELFPREGETVPRIRFPEFEGSGEWEVKRLGEVVASIDAGVSVNSGDRPAGPSEIGVLKTSCVFEGIFNPHENKVVNNPNEIERVREPVQANTIIISRMNTPALVGANAYISKNFENLFLPDRLWAAKSNEHVFMPFLAALLASDRGKRDITALATGTSGSMKNIAKSSLLELSVSIPSLPEQQKIASVLTSLDDRITVQAERIETLKEHKKGLMQQLFPVMEG